jgi:hypothetical protein
MGHREKQSGVEPCLRQAGAALQKGRRAKAAELRKGREALRYLGARAAFFAARARVERVAGYVMRLPRTRAKGVSL